MASFVVVLRSSECECVCDRATSLNRTSQDNHNRAIHLQISPASPHFIYCIFKKRQKKNRNNWSKI